MIWKTTRTTDRERDNKLAPPVEDLPSPFLKRVECTSSTSALQTKRPSNGSNLLRAMAAANSASTRNGRSKPVAAKSSSGGGGRNRPSIASARRASEEARRVLQQLVYRDLFCSPLGCSCTASVILISCYHYTPPLEFKLIHFGKALSVEVELKPSQISKFWRRPRHMNHQTRRLQWGLIS
jgi:hypothetical protein